MVFLYTFPNHCNLTSIIFFLIGATSTFSLEPLVIFFFFGTCAVYRNLASIIFFFSIDATPNSSWIQSFWTLSFFVCLIIYLNILISTIPIFQDLTLTTIEHSWFYNNSIKLFFFKFIRYCRDVPERGRAMRSGGGLARKNKNKIK